VKQISLENTGHCRFVCGL